jgi:hypothetical protein
MRNIKGLFSTGISLLQVHGCIQKEKIIVSINPSCKHNFINVNLAKKIASSSKTNWKHTQVDNEDVQVYKDLKISMDKYVLHSDFYASDMANVDVVLGYPWMESVGTININVQKKFLKLWYKKKKITLQDISINKQVESKEAQAENVTGTDTSDEESVVEVIMEDKKQKQVPQHVPDTTQAPLGGELKKDTPLVKTSAYHHPHHPARKQPTRWQQISNKDNNPCMTDREVRHPPTTHQHRGTTRTNFHLKRARHQLDRVITFLLDG